jgi:asparagine synthetase B (glutamine-hydrolysing)
MRDSMTGVAHSACALAGSNGSSAPAFQGDGWRAVVAGPGPTVWVRNSGAALGHAVVDDVAVAVLGSGFRRLAATADDAARSLAARWQAHGPGWLDRQGGDLVAVVADRGTGVLAAGAASGAHRLYEAQTADGTALVSSLVTSIGAGRPADRRFEDFLLAHEFFPRGGTPFEGVRTVRPGSVVTLPSGDERAIEPAPVPEGAAPSSDPGDWTKQLFELLITAVERQAGAARDHAVLLGGFDSALVAALLVRLGHRVHTYTFGFEDRSFEQTHVDTVTQALGTDHSWVPITAAVIESGLTQFAGVYNQPISQPHYVLHTLASVLQVRADGFAHVFNGDGCDAAFLGHPSINQRARGVEVGAVIGRPAARGLLAASRPEVLERHLGHVWRLGRGVLEEIAAPADERGHLPFTILGDLSRRRLRRGAEVPRGVPVAELRTEVAGAVADLDPARRALHGYGLTGQSVTKVEGAVAGAGLSQSSPFQDAAVRAFAAALPPEALRPASQSASGMGKEVLVRMALDLDLLPAEVVLQPKQSPSTSPIDEWYAHELHPFVFRQLDGLPFDFDRGYVEDLLRPKWAEQAYRRRFSIDRHALRALGLLLAYASFTARTA